MAQQTVFDQILTAARDNNVAMIRQLLQMGAPATYTNRVGQSALHVGAMWGSVDAVKVLLEAKGDPNAANKLRGSTPLHAVALGRGPLDRRVECAKILIKGKGDPNKADQAGEKPMDFTEEEVLRVAFGAAPLILHKAVASRQQRALKEAIVQIQRGAVDLTMDSQNPNGESALFLAAGWPEGASLLLAARAGVDVQSGAQRTALHEAARIGQHRTLQLLIQAKAGVNIQDVDIEKDPRYSSITRKEERDSHRTALHYACELSNVLIVKMLLEARADVNLRDGEEMTPLHVQMAASSDLDFQTGTGIRVTGLVKRPEWNGRLGSVLGMPVASDAGMERYPVLLEGSDDGVALKAENLSLVGKETLEVLLEAGADVNLSNLQWPEGHTVLHEAARMGDIDLVHKVLAAGAAIDAKDAKGGLTALHHACRAKRDDVIRALLDAKADAQQKSVAGKTAVEIGETNGLKAETLALLRGEKPESGYAPAKEPQAASKDSVDSLTPEQRALLFLD